MRKKDRGIWKQITWAELAAKARHVGTALASLGFVPGDRAAVLAETGPDWVYADLGILGAGGVSVGIYPTAGADQVAELLRDCGAVVLFVQNEEQLDKALDARAACPHLRGIVVFNAAGLRDFGDAMCESLDTFLARGAAHDSANPGVWEAGIAAIAADDLALLIHTSGATGAPKGAMLNHRTVLFEAVNGAALMGLRRGDERLAFMPMCHVAERILGLYQSLCSCTVSNYAEDSDTVLEDLRELQPTVLGGLPRFWERFHARTAIRVADATWLQRLAYRWAIGVGSRHADARLGGRRPSALSSAMFWIARKSVLRNIRRGIGVDRLRLGFITGAPAVPELIRWYMALGVDLLEAYGMAECGLIAWMPPDALCPGTVGKPVPYGEIALSVDHEILVRGAHVFQGYWNRPDLTEAALRDGWLRTGDIGAMQDAHLSITGRDSDGIVTATGTRVAPAAIETALTFSPYIADAMLIGAGRPYLTCLLLIDHETIEKWAQDNAVPFISFASLARGDAVAALIGAELARVNRCFACTEQIMDFRLIDRRLEPEDAELTPAMKLRRGTVRRTYAALIETMYDGDNENPTAWVPVSTQSVGH
jgi:long-chain acyl-CoA synthetase